VKGEDDPVLTNLGKRGKVMDETILQKRKGGKKKGICPKIKRTRIYIKYERNTE